MDIFIGGLKTHHDLHSSWPIAVWAEIQNMCKESASSNVMPCFG